MLKLKSAHKKTYNHNLWANLLIQHFFTYLDHLNVTNDDTTNTMCSLSSTPMLYDYKVNNTELIIVSNVNVDDYKPVINKYDILNDK